MDVLDRITSDFDAALDDAEAALAPFLAAPLPAVAASVPPLDAARLHATLATAALALASGETPSG
jgi:hypothetical protein